MGAVRPVSRLGNRNICTIRRPCDEHGCPQHHGCPPSLRAGMGAIAPCVWQYALSEDPQGGEGPGPERVSPGADRWDDGSGAVAQRACERRAVMNAHTPGPWWVSDTNWATGYRIQAVVSAVDGDDIAQVTNVPDARLIAAAPELLEALEHIASVDLRGSDDLEHLVTLARGIQIAARKAVQKA